jgi:light-harvesting complex 1 beta chain
MEKINPMEKQGLYLGNVSDAEAKEFHNGFMMGFFIWLAVAVVAHYLVWLWRPWLSMKQAMIDIDPAIVTITSLLA